MRCERCWKILWENTIHTCVPYQYYEGITGYTMNKKWDRVNFKVMEVNLWYWFMIIKLLNWEKSWNIISLHFNEIDNNLKFNLE